MNIEVEKLIRVKANADATRFAISQPIYKEDYGLYLFIEGLDLPEIYTVDFSESETNGTSVSMLGNADGVLIPQQFIKSGKTIYAFLYLVGTEVGKTVYKFKIPNRIRPDRTNEEPTPEEQSTIDQAISALNTAVEKTAQDKADAGASAQSAKEDADRAEQARDDASTFAQRSANSAQASADYSESAQASATASADSAEASSQSAQSAEQSAQTASAKADSITGLTAQATTLPDGSSATANYNPETGVMSFGIPKGKDGTNGIDGDDGYSPTANVSKSGKTATITITDKNGMTSAQVSDGEDGTNGTDGISPSVSVTDITGGHRVVITDKDGAKSFDVEDGATGATPNLTIGTVETLEPSESATASITGTPENPVLNLGIPQGEQGEVTLEDYYKAFPTDTASGSIASFSDGADDLPLKSLVVNIDPVQDLHEQESPYPAGGGANKWDEEWELGVWNATGAKVNNDNAIRSKGYIPVSSETEYYLYLGTRYTAGLIIRVLDSNKSFVSTITFSNSRAFTIPAGGAFIVFCTYASNNITVYNNDIAINYPSTVTTYSPYENICPISGWTEVNVEQRGKNIINVNGDTWDNYNVSFPYWGHNASQIVEMVNALKPGTYTFTFHEYVDVVNNTEPGTYGILFRRYVNGVQLDIDARMFNTAVTTPKELSKSVTFTLTEDDVGTFAYVYTYAGFANHETQNRAKFYDFQIELGTTATPYKPYTGRSITIDLGQTVYGGKLDVLSGVLTVDRAMVDLGTLNWSRHWSVNTIFSSDIVGMKLPQAFTKRNAGIISSEYAADSQFSISDSMHNMTMLRYNNNGSAALFIRDMRYTDGNDFKAAVSGVQLCYELADPIEIQLSANQINSLLGVNNIWADTGDASVSYRADTKLYIEKLTQPEEDDMIADSNIVSGQYFMVGNSLYKATANIASGGQVIVGTNATRKSLSEALNEINA